MSIVTSTYAVDGPVQADGSQWVIETHTDHLAVAHKRTWRALNGINKLSVLIAQAVLLAESLADEEFEQLILSPGIITVQHQTGAQFASRMRERFRESSMGDAAKLATWILDHIDNGNFTEAQVRNAFGLNVTNWNILKSKLTTLRTNWNAVQSAAGE